MPRSQTSALWLARAIYREATRNTPQSPFFVRAWTEGSIPDASDLCEAISDPFADLHGNPWQRASTDSQSSKPTLLFIRDLELEVPCKPSKVIGVGRNYAAHAAELGNALPKEPLLFFKPSSCLIASQRPVSLPRGYARIDMEAELVIVIGRQAHAVSVEQAWTHVAGYCLGNDISCRDLQKSDPQWTRAKGFDGFGPIGPWIRMVPPGWVLPTTELRIRGYVNGSQCQDASLSDMIFNIPSLIAYISACMTLNPGDLIYTGTPEGVHPIEPGDSCQVELGGKGLSLGQLSTPLN